MELRSKERKKDEDLPFLKLFAMGLILYAADHEVCQVAVLVSNDVEKPICERTSIRERYMFCQFCTIYTQANEGYQEKNEMMK